MNFVVLSSLPFPHDILLFVCRVICPYLHCLRDCCVPFGLRRTTVLLGDLQFTQRLSGRPASFLCKQYKSARTQVKPTSLTCRPCSSRRKYYPLRIICQVAFFSGEQSLLGDLPFLIAASTNTPPRFHVCHAVRALLTLTFLNRRTTVTG